MVREGGGMGTGNRDTETTGDGRGTGKRNF